MKLNIDYKENLESILASVKTGLGITIIPQSLATRIESMNLSLKSLENYHRDIGLISYDSETINNVLSILPKEIFQYSK